MTYRKLNNIAGWIIGGIATLVYLITLEATASFWDCGEFLSVAYKIEVGHSPGAPLFMLMQRVFALFAGGNVNKIAWMMNAWSGIASGLTILFLFWTITYLAKKLLSPNGEEPSNVQKILIIGAGAVGALAYTFSDTFWFSAVEAEVYATSSLFTALSFWAIFKWEEIADRPYADRWLILLAYLVGLSIGVHLLNLLTIPTFAMVYYFRRYKPTVAGSIVAFFVGVVLLALVQFGIIQGVTIIASKFDVFFVNDLGMPFDIGALVGVLLIIGITVFLLKYASQKGYYMLHSGMLCIIFILIGFSSYMVPMIRSRADVPIDMTNPDNTISLVSYVQREQFGEQPLFYGPDYDASLTAIESKGNKYAKSTKEDGKGYYEVVGKKPKYVFEEDKMRFFPRIWDSNDPAHVNFYKSYLGLADGDRPSASDNMRFFMGYQMNWMWWRYFMWNYVGRQNDFEGQGEPKNGNWISGIGFVDKMFGRGDLNKMSDGYRNNGARNQLYFLPFILGILGLIYQYKRDKHDAIVVGMLFFFTGIAIGIYLNMPPLQPRERDYAFAGSTYAFAIWIGLGVLMVYDWAQRLAKGSVAAMGTVAICILAVPTLMAAEEWDDHNRSKKTLARATAYNALMSCAKNAVLFTFGDNETYPLWYLQEIEGIRTDVRIINTSLLGIDWYIDQLNYMINDADAVPMVWKREDYLGDRHNYVSYVSKDKAPQLDIPNVPQNQFYPLKDVCEFMISDKKLPTNDGESVNYFPTKNFALSNMSKEALVQAGLLSVEDSARAITDMRFTLNKENLMKDDIAQLNIIAMAAAQNWKRPIYYSNMQEMSGFGNIADYMQLEGTVYRLMPYKLSPRTDANGQVIKSQNEDQGTINVNKTTDLFLNTYIWGGAERNDLYIDEKNRQTLITFRLSAARVADELSAMGQKDKAIKVLDKVMNGISEHSFSYDFTGLFLAESYYRAGAIDKASKLTKKVVTNCKDDLRWIGSLNENGRESMANEMSRDMSVIYQIYVEALRSNDNATLDWILKTVADTQRELGGLPDLNTNISRFYDEMKRLRTTPPAVQQIPVQQQ